jgi:uncharacterized protein (DUF697 family)
MAHLTTKTNDIIKNNVVKSMAIAMIPLPLLDLVAISSIRLKMLGALAKLYQVEFSQNLGQSLTSTLLGGVMPLYLIKPMASVVKMIPFIGQATGIVTLSVLEGAATYAIGKVFARHFESGGTLRDFDPKKAKKSFATEFKKGQRVATELKKRVKKPDQDDENI